MANNNKITKYNLTAHSISLLYSRSREWEIHFFPQFLVISFLLRPTPLLEWQMFPQAICTWSTLCDTRIRTTSVSNQFSSDRPTRSIQCLDAAYGQDKPIPVTAKFSSENVTLRALTEVLLYKNMHAWKARWHVVVREHQTKSPDCPSFLNSLTFQVCGNSHYLQLLSS